MRRLVCAIALSLIAAPALADPPEGELQASPGAIASGLIGDSAAEGVFEVAPDEHLVAVRHARSGLVCRMAPDNANRLVIFPQAARGEDVACDSSDGRQTITLYATRFSFATTLDEQAVGAEAAIRQRYPDAQVVPLAANGNSTQAPHRTLQFLVHRQSDRARMFTSASIAIIGEWVIKSRYTVLAPDDAAIREGQRMAEATFAVTLGDLAPRAP